MRLLKRVVFELKDDVITCGVNTESNFLNSEDCISGAVLRAGFANQLALECELDNRDFFIEVKDEEKCKACEHYNICKAFSEMKFSFLYKKDCVPAPLTTKKCKLNSKEHPIKDVMLENGEITCAICKKANEKAGRMEDAKGYINLISKAPASISKNGYTHTAINYTSRIALDHSLYSTRTIARGQLFEGYIDDCDTDLINEGTVVYVGKYSSNGYGKLEVIKAEPAADEKDLKCDMITFSEKYGNKNGSKAYAPILLLSDARLNISPEETAKTTAEYKAMWKKLLFGDIDLFEIENVYAQNKIYRGYDTNKKWGKWEKEPIIQTLKGSSFLVSFEQSKEDEALAVLNELRKSGVGRDTKDGYGQIDVYNEIHMIGAE